MNREGLKERKTYYEKLMGWLLAGLLALVGGLSGLAFGKLNEFKLILLLGGFLLVPLMVVGILVLHFSILELIKKLEEDNGD